MKNKEQTSDKQSYKTTCRVQSCRLIKHQLSTYDVDIENWL